jgi:hypothetical protein
MMAAGLLGMACSDVGPSDELRDAQQRWATRGIATYELIVSRSCECPSTIAAPARIVVRDGSVESRRYSTGEPVDLELAEFYPDVKGLFALIVEAIRDDQLGGVEYDETTGYPRRIVLDVDGLRGNGVDGETEIDALLVDMASSPMPRVRRGMRP